MYAIRKEHPKGAIGLVCRDRQMVKPKMFKSLRGVARWVNSEKGQSFVRTGWRLEVVDLYYYKSWVTSRYDLTEHYKQCHSAWAPGCQRPEFTTDKDGAHCKNCGLVVVDY
jgi:hypothetical protein